MGKITTVIGIERPAIGRWVNLSYCKAVDGKHEVLLSINWHSPRRLALCTHYDDAIDIIKALEYAHGKGIV